MAAPRFVGRHPIFARDGRVVGYELLYRRAGAETAAVTDDDEASLDVMYGTLLGVGLDAAVGTSRAWVNVSPTFLADGRHRFLDPERVVLELLESAVPSPELTALLRLVATEGYTLALDDFVPDQGHDELLDLASIVKLELPAIPLADLGRHVAVLRARGLTVLVEKVETVEERDAALVAGADLLQGYFFARPEVLSSTAAEPSTVAALALLARLNAPTTDVPGLTRLIGTDIALAQAILHAVNSGFFALRCRVASLHQAVVLLGTARLRQLATLLLLARATGKPSELSRQALLRGELAAGLADAGCAGASEQDRDAAFTLGLLSTVDAFTDLPLADAVDRLGLDDLLSDALVRRAGRLGEVLALTLALESGRPGDGRVPELDDQRLAELYGSAVQRMETRWSLVAS